ncbi:Immunoglobulin A1 protease autotransporter [Frankliniella fusca]|uniref:Immunoglobulin A1 protease autotransporter n=1 Tax=Frankliniella fusca TaxID=407009 RepID=A0AAE1HDN0_9NEOP|nr:Immunoglobulin A1 protease autotransporter [Frankliniella fusca]
MLLIGKAPVSTTKRPRAQPCKWMGLRGRKRKRCRQFITNRFKFGLAARRRVAAPPRLDLSQAQDGAAAAAASPSSAVLPTAPTLELTSPGTPLDYEWLKNDFDDQVSHADDDPASPDPVDDEVILEPVDPEQEKVLHMVEEEVLERIHDGVDDNLTVNQTLAEVLDETIQEISDVSFRDCRVRELSESDYQVQGLGIEWQMLSYMRTLLTFSVVSILLLVLGFLSALYTFKEPRYTFKRLSAGIQFISFCGLLVVIQVFRKAAEYEQLTQLSGVPLNMGYSQVLAWLSLAGQVLSSFFFLLYSRKKKRNKAPNEEVAMADEPTIIGRQNGENALRVEEPPDPPDPGGSSSSAPDTSASCATVADQSSPDTSGSTEASLLSGSEEHDALAEAGADIVMPEMFRKVQINSEKHREIQSLEKISKILVSTKSTPDAKMSRRSRPRTVPASQQPSANSISSSDVTKKDAAEGCSLCSVTIPPTSLSDQLGPHLGL